MDVKNTSESLNQQFSIEEYRRYGLIGKTLLTDEIKSTVQVWKLKFALLYPYDARENQPLTFHEGQCMEISIRLPNGFDYL
jgi:hypothetical protein